jgi:hypothetical protein
LFDIDSNAYNNQMSMCKDDNLPWFNKLGDPHVSVTAQYGAPQDLDSQIFTLNTAPIDQKNHKGPQYNGHVNTATPLLTYRTQRVRAWVTMSVDFSDPQHKPWFRPADDKYYHISLCKLEKKGKK